MKRSQTALVLAKIAAVDNRRLDPPDADMTPILDSWHEAIGDLGVQDCLDAVRDHRRETTEWLQPAHVRDRVIVMRRARVENVEDIDLVRDVHPDDPHWARILQGRRAALLDGLTLDQAKAIPAPEALRAIGGAR